MKGRFLHVGRSLIALGIICIFLGIGSFFPAFSYKPWFADWSVRIACPIWNGVMPGAGLTFGLVTLVTSCLQFAVALAAVLIGPLCYFAQGGVSGQGYLGYAVSFPYPYRLPPLCLNPPLLEFYHLGQHLLAMTLALVIFALDLAHCIRLAYRFNATGTLRVRDLLPYTWASHDL